LMWIHLLARRMPVFNFQEVSHLHLMRSTLISILLYCFYLTLVKLFYGDIEHLAHVLTATDLFSKLACLTGATGAPSTPCAPLGTCG
jgi:hypothetical protein